MELKFSHKNSINKGFISIDNELKKIRNTILSNNDELLRLDKIDIDNILKSKKEINYRLNNIINILNSEIQEENDVPYFMLPSPAVEFDFKYNNDK